MNTANASTIQAGYEPISGYRLLEKLGSGGFGEVWRAEAPGGLHKAIKFVHGALNERQATRELRSLERIKGVHHPFLLTLERFEVADGRLTIVTELADGSLEDVFRRHRDRGSCGIPRAALLAYLHDAADALDYLHERYQLQHLDVKPGNLLMVGGHVKVADFGLLKDLRDVDCSVVGGLTPIYAPPEVFDGRPSSTSDQYSLAVMYQELLTGTRPFTGRTIAQLATQHVHSAPNLDPLPACDRPVIARALEKTPGRRYGGCRELVEALRAAADRSSQIRGRRDSAAEGGGDTWEIDGDTRTSTIVPSTRSNGAAVKDLPRLRTGEPVAQATESTHTLLVAVGGAGAECLHLLRERIAASSDRCPIDLHSVLIDTATDSIDAARLSETSHRTRPCTPIWIPLRTPGQYRDSGTKHLASVSRRWVYNVPRSGRTEGLRPLGRLALVDHGSEVFRGLSEAVRELAEAVGEATPRVYVVGSLGGGTGSGTAWDLIHLLRHLLDQHGLPQATVIPLLASPALETSGREPLATADCHAALSEMHHYLLPGNSYPGDPGIGWPSVPAARSPLGDAYVIAARDLTNQSPTPVEMIRDYIWADSTAAGPLLRAARDSSASEGEESEGGNAGSAAAGSLFEPVVRSLGITPLRSADQAQRPRLARVLASKMLHAWLGRPMEARERAKQLHEPLAVRCGLDVASLVAAHGTSRPATPEASAAAIVPSLQQHSEVGAVSAEGLDAWVRATETATLPTPDRAAEEVERRIQALRRELSLRLKERELDMTTALQCVARIAATIQAAAESRDHAAQRHRTAAHQWEAALRGEAGRPLAELIGSAETPGPATRWVEQRSLATVEQQRSEFLSALAGRLAAMVERLTDHAAQLAAAIQLLGETRATEAGSAKETWEALPEAIRRRGDQMLATVHQAVALSLLAAPVVDPERVVDGDSIASTTSAAARQAVDRALDATRPPAAANGSANPGADSPSEPREDEADPITRAVRSIRPAMLACGGQQRLLLLVGSEVERVALQKQVADAHGGTLSVAIVPGIEPLLVHEAQQIPLSRVLNRLASTLGGDQQISARLQSRSDIRWNSSETS